MKNKDYIGHLLELKQPVYLLINVDETYARDSDGYPLILDRKERLVVLKEEKRENNTNRYLIITISGCRIGYIHLAKKTSLIELLKFVE